MKMMALARAVKRLQKKLDSNIDSPAPDPAEPTAAPPAANIDATDLSRAGFLADLHRNVDAPPNHREFSEVTWAAAFYWTRPRLRELDAFITRRDTPTAIAAYFNVGLDVIEKGYKKLVKARP